METLYFFCFVGSCLSIIVGMLKAMEINHHAIKINHHNDGYEDPDYGLFMRLLVLYMVVGMIYISQDMRAKALFLIIIPVAVMKISKVFFKCVFENIDKGGSA